MKEEEEIRTIREEIVCLMMNLSLLSVFLTFVYEIFILCCVVLFLVR